jgi:D-alanyl-D-alanine carboxypeptidase
MNVRQLTAITATLLAAAVAVPAGAAVAGPSPVRQLEQIAAEAVAAGVPGVIVQFDDGPGPAVDIVRQAPWSVPDHRLQANDRFRMGSNTKTITATLVLQLVGQHRLALEDTVEKWLPGAVPNGQNITLRMLLNHTSGLADYAYDPEVLAVMTGNQVEHPTAGQLLAIGTGLPPEFTPGDGWLYSNTGYVALGLVVEKVTGRTLAELVRLRIAEPLGLRDTYLPTDSTTPRRIAHGYEPDAAHLAPILPPGLPEGFGFVGPNHHDRVNVTAIDQSWDGAAGAIISTTADWARFDTALMTGKLFPKHLVAEMTTSVETDAADHGYGLGLEEYRSPCGTVWGHDGALPGYRSDNFTDRSGKRTVSILSTTHFGLKTDPAAGEAEQRLVDAAICAMLGSKLPAER